VAIQVKGGTSFAVSSIISCDSGGGGGKGAGPNKTTCIKSGSIPLFYG
jgi:hypothetical protein